MIMYVFLTLFYYQFILFSIYFIIKSFRSFSLLSMFRFMYFSPPLYPSRVPLLRYCQIYHSRRDSSSSAVCISSRSTFCIHRKSLEDIYCKYPLRYRSWASLRNELPVCSEKRSAHERRYLLREDFSPCRRSIPHRPSAEAVI